MILIQVLWCAGLCSLEFNNIVFDRWPKVASAMHDVQKPCISHCLAGEGGGKPESCGFALEIIRVENHEATSRPGQTQGCPSGLSLFKNQTNET